jgi:hypothetical protein
VNVWLEGRRLRVDPAHSIGKGGEADVFDLGDGRALKLFKGPEHPDLEGLPEAQDAARQRLSEHQQKLRCFPAGLPPRVVAPEALATTRDGRVLGYAMRLVRDADVLLRLSEAVSRRSGVTGQQVADVFRDLRATLVRIHAAGVVIGDFNDLNVLVAGSEAHVVDADSFQFGGFPCRVFTERFLDPLLCDPGAPRPAPARPYTTASDWYAFEVMLLRSLLLVDPYGGVYAPPAGAPRVSPFARPLRRISIFHPLVRYPKPALPPDVLPDDLLQHFHCVFEKDRRGPFPEQLLGDLRWTRCSACGREHARGLCPDCRAASAAAIREVAAVRGAVRCDRVFVTRGVILAATAEDDALRVLVHEDGRLKREQGTVVLEGDPRPGMQFLLARERSLVVGDSLLVVLSPEGPPERRTLDTPIAAVATSRGRAYWVAGGRLMRDGALGPERVGDVLPGQTRIWVGPTFGFGFSRAGTLSLAFVFDAKGRGLNDGVRLPALAGQLVDADCVFGDDSCWFFSSLRSGGRSVNRCLLLRRDGSLVAATEAEAGDGSWLGEIRGRTATGSALLVPTDDGVVRVEAQAGRLSVTRVFTDTEPFVDAGCRLLSGHDGLYVVDRREVRRLRLS